MWHKLKPWGYLILLVTAPSLVGVGEVLSRKFPVTDKFFGQPVSLVSDILVPSVILPTLAAALIGCLVTVILVGNRGCKLHVTVKVGVVILILFTLWGVVFWTYWHVIAAHHSYWDLLFAPPVEIGLWTVVGLAETMGIVFIAADLFQPPLDFDM